MFHLSQVPTDTCSVTCAPGSRKFHQKQIADCCFDCFEFPGIEVYNEIDTSLHAEAISEIEYLLFF